MIPYVCCYENSGMIKNEEGFFTVSFLIEEGIPEKNARFSHTFIRKSMEEIFSEMGDLKFSFTIVNKRIPMEEYLSSIQLKKTGLELVVLGEFQ